MHGNVAGWRRVLHFPFPYPFFIYLPVTLPIPNEDEKLNPIPFPDGFGYPRPILALNNFFNKKLKFFLQPLEKYCNALSNDMFTLTFIRPIDLVAPLNINGSFYNTTIIKQNNMTYQHKVFFFIRDEFAYEFGVGTYIPVTHPIPVF